MSLTLLHNPRCSKSRAALALLEAANVSFTTRKYLQEPLSAAETLELARAVGVTPAELTRRREVGELDLTQPLAELSDEAVAELIAAHPGILERPILWRDDGKAIIGRPPENIKELL